jgi:hypothetical protein
MLLSLLASALGNAEKLRQFAEMRDGPARLNARRILSQLSRGDALGA